MTEPKAKVVPKFSSFRPTAATSAKETLPASREKNRTERSCARNHRDSSEEKRRKRKSHHARKREILFNHEPKINTNEKVRAILANPATLLDRDDQHVPFFIDKKGDTSNLTYRSSHKYSIPIFRRAGYGSVLGLDPGVKIDKDLSTEKLIILSTAKRSERLHRPLLVKSAPEEKRSLRLISASNVEQVLDMHQDFVAFSSSGKRRRRSESPDLNRGEIDYRSIKGKAKASKDPADDDLEFLSGSSVSDSWFEDAGTSARIKNGELTRKTREDPQSLARWLDLVEHQPLLLPGVQSDKRLLSNSEKRILAEIRIDIYEKAIQGIGKDSIARSTLWIGLLKEGTFIWETKKLASKWEEALQAHPDSLLMWTEYLDFIQTNPTDFRYERCKAEFVKCLGFVAKAYELRPGDAHISHVFAYVLIRASRFMQQSGYQELAEALWQSVLEFRFFLPNDLRPGDSLDTKLLSAFEAFWESEVPRIGESNAKGWSSFSEDSENFADPIITQIESVDGGQHLFRDFADAERTMAKKLAHPGRSADESGDDDPYHVIFFSDIKPFLLPNILRTMPFSDLIHAFLCFLGLPPLPLAKNRSYERWWLDPLIRPPGNTTDSEIKPQSFSQVDTETLFSDAFEGIELKDPAWVERALRSLLDAVPEFELLAEYLIALEFHFVPERAAKTAKSLLKAHRSSLVLYNCYALLESRSDRIESSSRVFATAIGSSTSLDDEQRNKTVLLWRTWVWEALRADDFDDVLSRIASIGESIASWPLDTPPTLSPSSVLRATNWLSNGRDGMISTGNYHIAVLHAELLALLSYFRNDRSIEEALVVYKDTCQLFTDRKLTDSPAHEHLHQCRAQLLAFHIRNVHLFKPSIVRDALFESIKLFPNNTMFLSAYVKNEARFRIDDRVRSLMSNIVLNEKHETIVSWFLTLWAEQQRGLEFGGTVHAIRSTFEKAVESVSGKHSIALWTAYFHFEHARREYKRAREVFFRGLRCLPWSKWFLLLAFEALDGILDFEELCSVWNVFGERELRVVVDVEELIDTIRHERIAGS